MLKVAQNRKDNKKKKVNKIIKLYPLVRQFVSNENKGFDENHFIKKIVNKSKLYLIHRHSASQ